MKSLYSFLSRVESASTVKLSIPTVTNPTENLLKKFILGILGRAGLFLFFDSSTIKKNRYALKGRTTHKAHETIRLCGSSFGKVVIFASILTLFLVFFNSNAKAQCTNCNSNYPGGTFSTTSSAWTTVGTNIYGGEYAFYNVSVGSTYVWTTCGLANYDTQLTLRQGSNCNGTYIAYNDDACSTRSQITWTATFTGTVTVLLSKYNCSNNTTNTRIDWRCSNFVALCTPPSVVGFGTNTWNVLGYEHAAYNYANLATLTGETFKGYYTDATVDINSQLRWGANFSPSSAAPYTGCPITVDNHTVLYKRQGFPDAFYQIDLNTHDDGVQCYVNGTLVYQIDGCCADRGVIWSGRLCSTSTVEFRVMEGVGGSNLNVDFIDVPFTAGTISGTSSICPGGSSNLTTTGNPGGTWSSSNSAIASVNASGVVSAVSSGNATITYTVNGGACGNASATLPITVVVGASAGVLSGTQTACVGATTTFTSNGTAGGTWTSDNSGIASANASTGVISGVSGGTATITYTVLGSGGCPNATATRTVTVSVTPTSNAGADATLCPSQTTVLNGSSNTSDSYVYTLNMYDSFGDGWNGGYLTAFINGTASGTYSAGGYGTTATINILPGQTLYFTYTSGSWEGENSYSIALNGTTVYAGGPTPATGTVYTNNSHPQTVTYAWTPSTALSSATILAPTCSATGTTTYTLTVTKNGCSSADQVLVTVLSGGNAGVLSGTQTACIGATTTFTSNGTAGGTWSSDNSGIASANASTGVISGVSAGTATITYTVLGSGGCPNATATRSVTVDALPVVSAGPDQTICNGQTAQLAGSIGFNPNIIDEAFEGGVFPPSGWSTSVTNAAYTWGTTTGVAGMSGTSAQVAWNYTQNEKLRTPSVSLSNLSAASLTFDISMSYYWSVTPYNNMDVNVKVSSDGGSTWTTVWSEASLGAFTTFQTYPITVDLASYLGSNIIVSFEYVGNDAANLYLDNVKVIGTPILAYAWAPSATLSNATIATPSASPIGTTTYTLNGTLNGCSSADQVVVTVASAGAISGTQEICSNGSTTFTSNGDASGTWSSGTPGVATVNASTGAITAVAAGTSTITYTVTGTGGCSATRTVTVNAVPTTPTVTVVDNCNNTSTLSTAAAGTLAWSTAETTSTITVSTADTYTVTQTVNGCTSSTGSGVAAPKSTPATPVVSVVNDCGLSTLSFTPAANATIAWSNSATTASTTSTTNATLTVTQTVNGCLSSAGSGSAVPLVVPTAPTATASQNFCITDNATVASLAYTNVAGNTYTWYDAATAGNTVATSTPLPTATTNYYLAAIGSNGCSSLTRTAVAATETALALATVSIVGTTTCPGGEITFTATPANGGNSPTYQWYNGGVPILNATGNTYIATGLAEGAVITVKMIPSGSCVTVCPN